MSRDCGTIVDDNNGKYIVEMLIKGILGRRKVLT